MFFGGSLLGVGRFTGGEDEEYVRHTQEIHTRLGDGFGRALATKFVQGIADGVARKVVNSQLDDKFGIEKPQMSAALPLIAG